MKQQVSSKKMKILMINGSPRLNGNTTIALDEMKKVFHRINMI